MDIVFPKPLFLIYRANYHSIVYPPCFHLPEHILENYEYPEVLAVIK